MKDINVIKNYTQEEIVNLKFIALHNIILEKLLKDLNGRDSECKGGTDNG